MWILKKQLEDLDVSFSDPPKDSPYDISIKLFKELKKGKKIEEITKEICDRIGNYIEKYEVVNGYMNIRLNFNEIIKNYYKLLDFSDIKKEKILIEHTSVNPNKALHIGHLRNSILGDSLYRLFNLLGHKVTVLNYIDDTGSQVADVVLGFYYLGFPLDPNKFDLKEVSKKISNFLNDEKAYEKAIEIIEERMNSLEMIYGYRIPKKFDHYCGDFVYVIVNRLYEIFPNLENYRREILKKIEEGNNEVFYLSKEVVRRVLIEQLKTLWNFDIYYDLLNKESDIIHQGSWEKTFKILKERGLIEYEREGDKRGTYVIDLSRWKEFDGYEDKKKVLIRSDGTVVYLAKDIAYAFWKLNIIDAEFEYSEFIKQPNGKVLYETDVNGRTLERKFNDCDISINVIGSEQSYLQLIIKKIIEELFPNKKYVHYRYNLVMLSKETTKMFGVSEEKDIVKMSGRKGIFINSDNLLEKATEISRKKLLDRGVLDKTDELAFKIARSTICFEILKYDPNSVVVFDLDRMTNIEEGNALYLMYTYARINTLIKKSGLSEEEIMKRNEIKEITDIERKLLKNLFMFKDILIETYKNLEINKLAKYSIDLARIFNEFYQNIPIIPKMDEYPHRIFLVLLTKIVLEKLFYILKIDTVERI
ncbi:MAG: arginine--tRNA ligase [Candidatus Nanoclepta minutus]|uniref:arginine--tRNA ligase n=1 Tax=Candidatus Nanoclepta minutus TaxID=1940235 RepID=A0A397WN84_9ARCH|nr:MAG: arginine--tRNA ligase [Candidatus Nanoclepta minutus]